MEIAIINGPNLNLLGQREPEKYGEDSFEPFLEDLGASFPELVLHYFQSNHEGELVEAIQNYGQSCRGLILNPAAFTHSSIALADAVRALAIPTVEVHITNIYRRESYRHRSYVSAAVKAVISGCGLDGYRLALMHLATL